MPTAYFKEIKHNCVQRTDPIKSRKKGVPKPPSNVDLLPTTYSDLNYFWRCPFEYQLRSLMGFGPGVTESYGYGQQIHNVLAEIHKRTIDGQDVTPEDAMELMEKRFHLRYTRDGEEYKPLSKLKEAAKRSLRRYLEMYPSNKHYVLDAEKLFEFVDRDSGALIRGSIDLLQRIEETSHGVIRKPVAVVDFKTHGWKDIDKFLNSKREVEKQLLLYAIAVKRALGFDALKAKAYFLSQKPPDDKLIKEGASEVIDVDISQEKQKIVLNSVKEAIDGIRESVASEKFELKGCKNKLCRHCDFREICPGFTKWKKEDKVTPRPRSYEDTRAEEMSLLGE